jgi:hypothetical protein
LGADRVAARLSCRVLLGRRAEGWQHVQVNVYSLINTVKASNFRPYGNFGLFLQDPYPPITYYWTGILILDHSYLVENLKISKIAESKALEPLKFSHFCISNFRACWFPNEIWVVKD